MGKNAGPGRLRSTARTSPKTRLRTSAIRNSWTFRRNRAIESGSASQNRSASKNARGPTGHPGEWTTPQPIAPMKTTVLARAMSTARPPTDRPSRRREALPPVIPDRARRLLERRRPLVRDPRVDDAGERAVVRQRRDGRIHAGGQGAAEVEHDAEVLHLAGGRQRADDRAVVELDRRGIEGRRQVDDDAVDLAGAEGLEGAAQIVVDGRVLGRLDVLDDVRVARRAQRGPELEVLQTGDGRDGRDRCSGVGDDRLVE